LARSRRRRSLDAVSAALCLGALPLFGLHNIVGGVVFPLLLSSLRLQWTWSVPDPVVFWWLPVLAACVAANVVLAVAGWVEATPGRYRAGVLLLGCFDFAFLLAPGLAKWGAFWGQGTEDRGPHPRTVFGM
jgi:hypothetical protein